MTDEVADADAEVDELLVFEVVVAFTLVADDKLEDVLEVDVDVFKLVLVADGVAVVDVDVDVFKLDVELVDGVVDVLEVDTAALVVERVMGIEIVSFGVVVVV